MITKEEIEREASIRYANEHDTFDSCKQEGFIAGANYVLERANASKWISVKDRLPLNEDLVNEDVLFMTSGGVVRLGCYDYEDGFWHERYGGKYICASDKRQYDSRSGITSHWQPLPLPLID